MRACSLTDYLRPTPTGVYFFYSIYSGGMLIYGRKLGSVRLISDRDIFPFSCLSMNIDPTPFFFFLPPASAITGPLHPRSTPAFLMYAPANFGNKNCDKKCQKEK